MRFYVTFIDTDGICFFHFYQTIFSILIYGTIQIFEKYIMFSNKKSTLKIRYLHELYVRRKSHPPKPKTSLTRKGLLSSGLHQ